MWTRRSNEKLIDAIDELSDAPSGANRAHGRLYGVLFAGLIAALGAYFVVTERGWFINARMRGGGGLHRDGLLALRGPSAVWLGYALLAFAAALHFRSFWGTHPRLARYHEPLKIFAIAALLITTVVFVYHLVQVL